MQKKLSNVIISIDGPAGSGKQRIAKYIARININLFHLDSGVLLYRRITFIKITNNKINPKKEYRIKINNLITSIQILSHTLNHPKFKNRNYW